MAHRDLLPQSANLRSDLAESGLTGEQVNAVLVAVSYHLRMWADYYSDEYQKIGDKDLKGAHEALQEQVDLLNERV